MHVGACVGVRGCACVCVCVCVFVCVCSQLCGTVVQSRGVPEGRCVERIWTAGCCSANLSTALPLFWEAGFCRSVYRFQPPLNAMLYRPCDPVEQNEQAHPHTHKHTKIHTHTHTHRKASMQKLTHKNKKSKMNIFHVHN